MYGNEMLLYFILILCWITPTRYLGWCRNGKIDVVYLLLSKLIGRNVGVGLIWLSKKCIPCLGSSPWMLIMWVMYACWIWNPMVNIQVINNWNAKYTSDLLFFIIFIFCVVNCKFLYHTACPGWRFLLVWTLWHNMLSYWF